MGRRIQRSRLDKRFRCSINKNKNGSWRITQNGEIVADVAELVLSDVKFDIDLQEQAKVAAAGRRGSIHAYISGMWVDGVEVDGRIIDYDPLKHPYFFYTDTLEPVHSATYAKFDRNGVSVVLEPACQDQVI